MKLIFLILTFFAAPAFAVGIGNDNPPGGVGGNQLQMQTQGQAQFSNADSRARAQAYAASLSRAEANNSITTAPVSLTVNEAAPPANTTQHVQEGGTVNVRSVPNVFGGNVYPTAPCMGSSTVGAAALGWGASVGTSWADDECGIRETARSFQNLNLTTDAITVLCSSKYAKVAPVCVALAPRPTPQ